MKVYTRESLAVTRAHARRDGELRLLDHVRIAEQGSGRTVAEFIGTDDFARQFVERQRYEVETGRDEEPLLYGPIYQQVSDPSLPRQVTVYELGPAGVIFDEVREGGEVSFVTAGEGARTVPIKHYAVGLEYSKDVLVYNELWRLPLVERAAGQAFNALKNHVHLAPFLTATYGAANQTAASSDGTTRAEKILRTIEAGIVNSMSDAVHPRRGPYALLMSTADLFSVERALMPAPQQGVSLQAAGALGRVLHLIAYDGWTGQRGNRSVTYPGVTAGKAYLINLGNRLRDHQAYEKQPLQGTSGAGDLSRFVLEQVIYDSYFGAYCDPLSSTEELTLP
jgi:hypothetical protein